MIKLRKFEETDIVRLTGWVPDARFLRQWAGHQYQYPMNRAQLLKSIDRTRSERPAHFMFTAFRQDDGTAVGHIELMSIDYGNGIARLGRVLIGESGHRSQGMGTAMVAEAVHYAFNTLGLTEVKLGVFDCNQPAMGCFKKSGFTEYELRENAQQFEDESWNLVMMKLSRHEFLEHAYGIQ